MSCVALINLLILCNIFTNFKFLKKIIAMKKYFSITFSFIVLLCYSQIPQKIKKPSKANYVYKQSKKCSSYTALLISNLKQKKSDNYLIEHFNLTRLDNDTYVSAFIKTDVNFDESLLTELNVKLNTQAGNNYTSLIPINQLENVLLVDGLVYLEIGNKVEPKLDSALDQTWVNSVHNGTDLSQSYDGNGVVVGIIDVGFDYTHPTFYNAEYTQYRVSKVWEQFENGTPPIGYVYGNELVGQTAILNNANDGTDSGSHGTHVAGIAAGSGSIFNEALKGVAYESEIVLVPSNLSNVAIIEGVEYIFDYASSVGKPAVVNMSLGSHLGPHDGTSITDQWFDYLAGEGRILVGSAGNEGGDKLHLDYDLGSNETVYSFLTFTNNTEHPSAGSTFIDIWGEPGDDFNVAINVFNVENQVFEDYTDFISTSTDGSYNFTLQDSDPLYSDEVPVTIIVENSNPYNNKPHVYIEFDNTDQDELEDIYDYIMIEINGTNTSFDAWSGDALFTNLGATSPLIDGNTNVTVGEIGGTSNSIISVGAFTSKNEYTDIQGNTQYAGFYTGVGEIAPFSSLGPTADGRTKPDITAPGNVIISSVSSFDSTYNDSHPEVVAGLNDGTNDWFFASMQGTSMSSPMVTGIVALWLQANPALTPTEIKQFMQVNASLDSFTGSIPNNTWGFGKIDAHSTLQEIESSLNVQDYNDLAVKVYPNPTDSYLFFEGIENPIYISVYNMLGKKVLSAKETHSINVKELSNGVYFIRISDGKDQTNIKFLKN